MLMIGLGERNPDQGLRQTCVRLTWCNAGSSELEIDQRWVGRIWVWSRDDFPGMAGGGYVRICRGKVRCAYE